MYAVAKTIDPRRIIELGMHAGSSADAYLSASPSNPGHDHTNCEYIGIDIFVDRIPPGCTEEWKPLETADRLFRKMQLVNYDFVKAEFRSHDRLESADLR